MNYNEIYDIFLELKNTLLRKKEAIVKKNLQELNSVDEQTIILTEKISKLNIQNNNFSSEEKQELKKLSKEIKEIEENNEILIKHSLNVINNILSGILNITQNEKSSYNAKGLGCQNNESLDISSITEEA